MSAPKILAFAGSARRESFNKKLAAYAASQCRELGASVTLLDLAEHPMPLYDGDLEAADGLPENAIRVRGMMLEHDGLLLACPEYNGSITPLLKNVIDWCSRPSDGVGMTEAYRNKVACLMSASPGALGGMRGLVHVRAILSGVGMHVVPGDVAVGSAHEAFGAEGEMSDERTVGRLNKTLGVFIQTLAALAG